MNRLACVGVFFFLMTAVSCNGKDGENSGLQGGSTSLSYDYEYNGCKTGKQQYSSESAYCKGLQDEKKNSFCAQALRALDFKGRGCPGQFTPLYP